MENSLNDELFCSLKNELREVNAQIDVHSEKLMDLLDQKKNCRPTDSGRRTYDAPHYRISGRSETVHFCSLGRY